MSTPHPPDSIVVDVATLDTLRALHTTLRIAMADLELARARALLDDANLKRATLAALLSLGLSNDWQIDGDTGAVSRIPPPSQQQGQGRP